MKVVFVGDSADFHVLDKYKQLSEVVPQVSMFSGFSIEQLSNNEGALNSIDILRFQIRVPFLLKSQLRRNLAKSILYPSNILWFFLYSLLKQRCIYHSFTMYYIFICALSFKEFVATPQASEILLRMKNSYLYRVFALFSLRRAKLVIVDSLQMKDALNKYGIESIVHKNGFDTGLIKKIRTELTDLDRQYAVSLRGIRPLYRIDEIVSSRNNQLPSCALKFIYPGFDSDYLASIRKISKARDVFLGALDKAEMYRLLSQTVLAISVPLSDSSPRTVYESIFCGAAVAVSDAGYLKELPECMRARVVVVNLNDSTWFRNAMETAALIVKQQYIPSDEAMQMCDSKLLMMKLVKSVYEPNLKYLSVA